MENAKFDRKPGEDHVSERIPWHAAFIEAIQMELEAYRDILEFHPEYQLTSEPLKIDCVVIKKIKGKAIEKNIAAVFRDVNLLEYKSPGDYISIADFYKVYGYACLYASFEKTPVGGMTATFVESRYPRKLIAHLRDVRGYRVAETAPGVYIVDGDVFPIQIIDSRKLSAGENLWLKDLSGGLGINEILRISAAISKQGKAARIQAYLDAVTRANRALFEEAFNMYDHMASIAKTLSGTAVSAKWEAIGEARGEARGEERAAYAIAKNMAGLGYSVEAITCATGLDPEKVKPLMAPAKP